jgi:hypothetical protein
VDQLLDRTGLVPVVADGHVVGVLDPLRVLRVAQLRDELQTPVTRAPRASAI